MYGYKGMACQIFSKMTVGVKGDAAGCVKVVYEAQKAFEQFRV